MSAPKGNPPVLVPPDRLVEALREVATSADFPQGIAGRAWSLTCLLESAANRIEDLQDELDDEADY